MSFYAHMIIDYAMRATPLDIDMLLSCCYMAIDRFFISMLLMLPLFRHCRCCRFRYATPCRFRRSCQLLIFRAFCRAAADTCRHIFITPPHYAYADIMPLAITPMPLLMPHATPPWLPLRHHYHCRYRLRRDAGFISLSCYKRCFSLMLPRFAMLSC